VGKVTGQRSFCHIIDAGRTPDVQLQNDSAQSDACGCSAFFMATVSFPSIAGLRRGCFVLGLGVVGAALGGCTALAPVSGMSSVSRAVPVPILVDAGGEIAAAEAHAADDPACFVLRGAGRSMEPIYANGTVIVVRERSLCGLRQGQAVVYRNTRGRYVAHILVEERPNGWMVRGLNNAAPDDELVTRDNFLGVVHAAYAPSGTRMHAAVAARPVDKRTAVLGARWDLVGN